MEKLKMVKPDAKVTLTIGTSFYQRIQKSITTSISELGEETMNKFVNEMSTMSKDHDFSEFWMELLFVCVTLNTEIEKKLIEQGDFTEEEITKQ